MRPLDLEPGSAGGCLPHGMPPGSSPSITVTFEIAEPVR
jgi:hypothetical protein